MAFHFRLAPLLRHRKRAEEEGTLALAWALRRRDAAAGRLAALRHETQTGREALAEAVAHGITATELRGMAEAIAALSRGAMRAEGELVAERTRAEQARVDLVRAAQERRLLERLETIQRDGYRRRLATEAQRQLDDVASVHRLWQRTAATRSSGSPRPVGGPR